MPEIVSCPQCSRQLRVPDELLGRQVKCPSCSTTFTAGSSGAAEPSPSPEYRDAPPSRSPEESERYSQTRQEEEYDEPKPKRRRRRDYDEDDDDFGRGRSYEAPHRGGLILTLAIIGFFCFGVILGPIAWVMGNNDLREMKAGRMDPSGEGLTNAGRIVGIVVTVLSIIGCLCVGVQFMGGFMQGLNNR